MTTMKPRQRSIRDGLIENVVAGAVLDSFLCNAKKKGKLE